MGKTKESRGRRPKITIERTPDRGVAVSAVINGYKYASKYWGCSLVEARQEFRRRLARECGEEASDV
jgi:hypothetical protein